MDNFTTEIQDELINLFASSGWALFLEDAKANQTSINTLSGIKGEQDLGFKQGQLAVLQGILGYEDTIRTIAEEVKTEDEDTPGEPDEITL